MYITYCRKCNHFFYKTRTENYCRECKTLLVHVPMTKEEFFALSVNERYKLAYKLTNDEK